MDKELLKQIISFYNKAQIRFVKKQYKDAIEYAIQGEKLLLNSENSIQISESLYFLLGESFFYYYEYDNARKYYFKLLENQYTGHDEFEIRFKIGKTYFKESNLEEAKKCFLEVYNSTKDKYFSDDDFQYWNFMLQLKSKINSNQTQEKTD